jgi:hypothetical protein
MSIYNFNVSISVANNTFSPLELSNTCRISFENLVRYSEAGIIVIDHNKRLMEFRQLKTK